MSIGDRLGVAGLIVALIGIAAVYLWPTQKWIGWTSLVLAAVLLIAWAVLEIVKRLGFGRMALFLSLTVGALVGISTAALIWHSVTSDHADEKQYAIGIRSAIIYDGQGDLSLYMVAYPSMFGATTSPIFYLMNVFITNMRSFPVTVEGYSVAVSDSERGPWEELMPIPLLSCGLYALGVPTPFSSDIAFPRGAYRLASSMKKDDMKHAALINPTPKLESELRRPIDAHATIGGWAAFDLKDHSRRGVRNYFRLTVRDSIGTTFSAIAVNPRRTPGESESDAQIGLMHKVGVIVDLSQSKVRYYSEPYPPLSKR